MMHKKLQLIVLALMLSLAFPSVGRAQLSEEEALKANNPLADTKSINLQNYYVGSIYDAPDFKANTALLRYVMPLAEGKILLRATMPFSTTPRGYTPAGVPAYSSGMGDFNFFATYTFSKPGAKTLLGVGPQVVIPTATSDYTGAGKWQVGGAFVAFNASSPVLQWGGLVTYQISVAGDDDRADTSLLVVQPFLMFQLGKGAYLRSTALWNFNLEDSAYNVPIGVGAGHVIKADSKVFNIFLEPQFTMLHEGPNQPAFQLFAGINCQF
jgi:hypothetical protein